MMNFDPHVRMSAQYKNTLFSLLVDAAMSHKLKQHVDRVDKLIEMNSIKQNRLSRHISIRGRQFNHSRETTASPMVNGRPLPKLTETVHFDLFDEGNEVFKEWQKLDRDRKVMTQCLVLLTQGLDRWVDMRDCIPYQLDAYLSAELKLPRQTEDIFFHIDTTAPYLRAQVEEYSAMFAIYGLSEMLGI